MKMRLGRPLTVTLIFLTGVTPNPFEVAYAGPMSGIRKIYDFFQGNKARSKSDSLREIVEEHYVNGSDDISGWLDKLIERSGKGDLTDQEIFSELLKQMKSESHGDNTKRLAKIAFGWFYACADGQSGKDLTTFIESMRSVAGIARSDPVTNDALALVPRGNGLINEVIEMGQHRTSTDIAYEAASLTTMNGLDSSTYKKAVEVHRMLFAQGENIKELVFQYNRHRRALGLDKFDLQPSLEDPSRDWIMELVYKTLRMEELVSQGNHQNSLGLDKFDLQPYLEDPSRNSDVDILSEAMDDVSRIFKEAPAFNRLNIFSNRYFQPDRISVGSSRDLASDLVFTILDDVSKGYDAGFTRESVLKLWNTVRRVRHDELTRTFREAVENSIKDFSNNQGNQSFIRALIEASKESEELEEYVLSPRGELSRSIIKPEV